MKYVLGLLSFWHLAIALTFLGPDNWWSSGSANLFHAGTQRFGWALIYALIGACLAIGITRRSFTLVGFALGAVLWGTTGFLILGYIIFTGSPANPITVLILFLFGTLYIGLMLVRPVEIVLRLEDSRRR